MEQLAEGEPCAQEGDEEEEEEDEEDIELVGPPAPATLPRDGDSLDIDAGLDSASTGIQPMSVSGPGDSS